MCDAVSGEETSSSGMFNFYLFSLYSQYYPDDAENQNNSPRHPSGTPPEVIQQFQPHSADSAMDPFVLFPND